MLRRGPRDGAGAVLGRVLRAAWRGGDRPEIASQFTAEDLLAVSMLSVPIDAYCALHVLRYQAGELNAMPAQNPLGRI